MSSSRLKTLGACIAVTVGAALLPANSAPVAASPQPTAPDRAVDDVTVIAILDGGLNPYHWDFLGAKMPQALDKDASNDLPLAEAPHTWLSGFPSPKAFKSYKPLKLTLEKKNGELPPEALHAKDLEKWSKAKPSVGKEINYHWIPGTKVIGAIDFGSGELYGNTSSHGVGTTSVAVGNLHGTCPECLLVFIDYGNTVASAEAAMEWATSQPWIDVVSNSYGHGGAVPKIYHGTTVEAQKKASIRGQTIVFSAGNGFENAYTVPNPTYMSSQKGPDWLITVGAVSAGSDNTYSDPTRGSAEHASYTGAGKPVDVAGLGIDYPSAYDANTISGTGTFGFSGTSNAAPTIAGTYARALYLARRDLQGPSRVQRNGVIARGPRFDCGQVRPDCELKDGVLTAAELRTRLLHGAVHTEAGFTSYGHGAHTPAVTEAEFMAEGHGTYFARESGDVKKWLQEFERVIGPIEGRAETLERPEGEREWFIVDSFCRQHLWGDWHLGYYLADKTELPGADPAWPTRSSMEEGCPQMQPPPPDEPFVF